MDNTHSIKCIKKNNAYFFHAKKTNARDGFHLLLPENKLIIKYSYDKVLVYAYKNFESTLSPCFIIHNMRQQNWLDSIVERGNKLFYVDNQQQLITQDIGGDWGIESLYTFPVPTPNASIRLSLSTSKKYLAVDIRLVHQ